MDLHNISNLLDEMIATRRMYTRFLSKIFLSRMKFQIRYCLRSQPTITGLLGKRVRRKRWRSTLLSSRVCFSFGPSSLLREWVCKFYEIPRRRVSQRPP